MSRPKPSACRMRFASRAPDTSGSSIRHHAAGALMDKALLSECVHCGFCLPTCPTWQLWGEEMDTPRGRIYLMEALADGKIELSPQVTAHFDRCLGCMACVTSCPSGVKYDRLIESTRAYVEERVERPRGERLLRSVVFGVLPHPRRARAALALEPLGRRLPLPGALRPLLAIAPPWRSAERPPALTPAAGERRGRVGLLTGCVQRVVFGGVNAATARVLAAEGYEVVAPRKQACCGALSVHAGRHAEGLSRAREAHRRVRARERRSRRRQRGRLRLEPARLRAPARRRSPLRGARSRASRPRSATSRSCSRTSPAPIVARSSCRSRSRTPATCCMRSACATRPARL